MSLRPPRPGPARRAPLAAALVLGLPLVLTGCGANFQAQTYQERTVADGTNAAVGAIAVRNVTLLPPKNGDMYEAGEDIKAAVTLTNDGPEPDRLVEVSSPDAADVTLLQAGTEVTSVELPPLGTTGSQLNLLLTGVREDLRPGRYVELTLRFRVNGEVTVSTPVATTGKYDKKREHSENFHPIGGEAH